MKILLPVFTDDVSNQTLDIASDLTKHTNATLIITGMEAAPEQTPLSHPTLEFTSRQRTGAYIRRVKELTSPPITVEESTRVGHQLSSMILQEVEDREIDKLVLEQTDETSATSTLLRNHVQSTVESGACDVVLTTGTNHLDDITSLLVPIAGGPHSGLAVDVAKGIAAENDAWIELFHVVEPDASPEERDRANEYIEAAMDRLDDFENVDTWMYEAPDIAEAIIEQTRYYDITIIGAPRSSRLKRFVFGSKANTIQERADSTVVTARAEDADQTWFESWLGQSV